jgi:nucleotide-binding universal stress UspA family protein
MNESERVGGSVLLAYDGSEYAKAAIAQSGQMLPPGRRAIVLTVVTPLESVPYWAAPMVSVPADVAKDINAEVERDALATAVEGAELANIAGFAAEPLVDRGDPTWNRIVKVADKNDLDLIVIGSHGRRGFSYVMLGSVAAAVIQHSRKPVLVCRRPEDSPAASSA